MIQDNTTKWKVRKFTDFASNQAMPLGYVHWSISPIVPTGELPLIGGTYDRSLYADLWSWANDNGLVVSESEWQAMATAQGGSCSKFSDGNGSTTFRVPALKCWIKGASGIEEVGSYLQAGLPNITGGVGSIGHGTNDFPDYGALSHATDDGSGGYSSAGGTYKILLDASKSNPIYGNSETVQPPSILGIWVIVAYGSISNIGNLDATNVMQAVERVQTGLGKVDGISDYIVESYRNGTEWYEVYKSGKVRQGGKTTSPSRQTVTFLKPFKDKNYFVTVSSIYGSATESAASAAGGNGSYNISTTQASIVPISLVYTAFWVAEGQGA